MTRSWALRLLVRFVLLAGMGLVLSAHVPFFAWAERGALAIASPLYTTFEFPREVRELSLEEGEEDWSYRVVVHAGGGPFVIERRYHPHAYVLLLFVSLVLATPDLSLRRRLLALAGGGAVAFALGVGLLLGDLDRWERAARSDQAPPPFAFPVEWLDSFHRTSAPALVPLLVWALVAVPAFRNDPNDAKETGAGPGEMAPSE